MRISLIFLLSVFISLQTVQGQDQNVYKINIDKPGKKIIEGHLNLGGTNPQGDTLSVNNYYFERNGEPYYPINGEFHYSRYPHEYWEEAIRKLKAGGINLIATYVFWNFHEPQPGEFNWSGDMNLRRFVELCAKNDIEVILRIGPYAHAAVRNGGIPDWIYGRPFNVRSNDPGYLSYAERLYDQIGKQVEGLFYKDGGPIIGVQLENEYQHTSSFWTWSYPNSPPERTVARHDQQVMMEHGGLGVNKKENKYAEYGENHMKTLKRLAKEAGMDAPFYTATGWGNATIIEKGSIPVTAAYPYPTWGSRAKPSQFYLFKDIHSNPDYAPVSYKPELYPSFSAELGAGVMESYGRRPFVPQESMAPFVVRTVGSGSNGIGYYTYVGGSTPYMNGKFYSDIAKNKPKISHEHQSPIGEFGELHSSYYDLKLIHYFLQDYSKELAPTTTYLSETNQKITPEDANTLRYSVRAKEGSGFVFMHNFQDHLELKDHEDIQITIETGNGDIQIPENETFDLKKEAWAILPFNLNLNGINLRYSTTQPLVKLQDGSTKQYVFYSIEGFTPEFALNSDSFDDIDMGSRAKFSGKGGTTYVNGENGSTFSFTIMKDGTQHEFLVIPEEMALNSWIINRDKQKKLVFSPATVTEKEEVLELISEGAENVPLYVYGSPDDIIIKGANVSKTEALHQKLSGYEVSFSKVDPPVEMKQTTDRHWTLSLDNEKLSSYSSLNDFYLRINYEGDMVQAFIDGKMVGDDLYLGKPWIIGLKKFFQDLKSNNMYFYFHPLYPDAPFYEDFSEDMIPDFSDKKEYLNVKNIEVTPEYKAHFTIQDD